MNMMAGGLVKDLIKQYFQQYYVLNRVSKYAELTKSNIQLNHFKLQFFYLLLLYLVSSVLTYFGTLPILKRHHKPCGYKMGGWFHNLF